MKLPRTPLLRVVEPLGLYFRPGRNDHTALLQALAAVPPTFSGAVLDASLASRHEELRQQLSTRGLEVVLDPMAMELATPGGRDRPALRALEWAGDRRHTPSELGTSGISALADPIAKFTAEKRCSAVLAPTHYVQGFDDPWWMLDHRLVRRLRQQLDAAGCQGVPIYYRLAIPRKTLLDRKQRDELLAALLDLEIDALWLCLHPVSASCGPMVLKSYVESCVELASVGIPLVAERTGFLGLALLGFNAVGGIESGITAGEGFDANRLFRLRRDDGSERGGFSQPPRVYIDRLGVFLYRDHARKFMAASGMKRRFACQDQPCCRTPEDMIRDPRRHFLFTRADEVAQLTQVPIHNRPTVYLDFVRDASDDAVHAARHDSRFEKNSRRLGEWRLTLASIAQRHEYAETVAIPQGKRVRRRKTA